MTMYQARTDTAKAMFGADPFVGSFTPDEESDWLRREVLTLVGQKYKVLVNNYDAGKLGDVITGYFPTEIEQMLINGGVLELVTDNTKGK